MGRGQIGLFKGQSFRNGTLVPCGKGGGWQGLFRTKVKGKTVIYKECWFKKKKEWCWAD